MGQLGGLSLLNSSVPPGRLAEANAALNAGGYVPAGLLSVYVGYLSDGVGLTGAATVFGVVLSGLAIAGGAVVRWCSPRAGEAVGSEGRGCSALLRRNNAGGP